MAVAESLTDEELAKQIYRQEEEEEERRQREYKASEALARKLAQERESSASPSSRAGTATSSSSPSPPSRANACANRASDGSESHDEGGRTGVGSKGRETADARDGAGPDKTKRQRLSSYEASCVSSPTPPAPTHHDTPPDEADGRQGAPDLDITQGIVGVGATSDAALEGVASLVSLMGASVTDAEAALALKTFDDKLELAFCWLLAESMEEKKKLEREHEQRRRREQDDLKMALLLQDEEQKPQSRREEEDAQLAQGADETVSDDDDVIIVDDSPPPATQSCADGGAGASSGTAHGGMGRGEQKKKLDDYTKHRDHGESNRRSTRPSAAKGGGSSSSSHNPSVRKDPNSHAPGRSSVKNSNHQHGGRKSPSLWDSDDTRLDKRQTRGQSRGNVKFKCETCPKNAPPENFNCCIPTHFTKPAEQDAEDMRDKVDVLRQILLDFLHNANPTDKGIELQERSQNHGYTSDNEFTGPDQEKQNYKHIGENRTIVQYDQASEVANCLLQTLEPHYKGYLIFYLMDKDVRNKVCAEFFYDIYTRGYKGQEEVDGDMRTLPGGLQEKFMTLNRFFQIFWNPRLKTCSGTHWDTTDSILYMIQGKKTVELAAKDKLDLPTLPKWGEGEMMYFSRDAPSSAIDGLHDKIELKAGEALFLPKEVWHRVTSEPNSLAFSLGVTAQDISVENERQKKFLEEFKAAANVAQQADEEAYGLL